MLPRRRHPPARRLGEPPPVIDSTPYASPWPFPVTLAVGAAGGALLALMLRPLFVRDDKGPKR